jgi:hypothetical protein
MKRVLVSSRSIIEPRLAGIGSLQIKGMPEHRITWELFT